LVGPRVPREQKMLKGHLPRVIYHQAYQYTKSIQQGRKRRNAFPVWVGAPLLESEFPNYHIQESYRGTSLIRNCFLRLGGQVLVSEVPL